MMKTKETVKNKTSVRWIDLKEMNPQEVPVKQLQMMIDHLEQIPSTQGFIYGYDLYDENTIYIDMNGYDEWIKITKNI